MFASPSSARPPPPALERPGRADEASPAKALGVRPLGTGCKEKREFLGERQAGLLGVSPAAPLSPRL